jgi:hypothetical protein
MSKGQLACLIACVATAVFVITQWPEIERYRRLSSM